MEAAVVYGPPQGRLAHLVGAPPGYAPAVPRSWAITMTILILCLIASMVIALIKLL